MLDRWRWLKSHLPESRNDEKLIDIGCGNGAFSIGAARRGFTTLGLSWDERNQTTADLRAKICDVSSAKFEVQDVRHLDTRKDLIGIFDYAICFENVEHIIDDKKLLRDISNCLKPGGRLLLTTPYLHYLPITSGDMGPFSTIEDGGHVRRGYTEAMLDELCQQAGLVLEKTSFCSGFTSQKITYLLRLLSRINPMLAWILVLPLRLLPQYIDWLVTPLIRWPYFSICIEAYKPRYSSNLDQQNTALNDLTYVHQ
ncbi:methyltransferase [Acaryochloris marina MBIC11017]|uniref:Methyltransferase n=1 Tax=Acaryochloris marina (strain MBIC 11017) TaxID=329726 RepID=B0C9Y5_ACAM1|nr:methyltransferase [Acaryochloris marina MBIC11017]